MKRCISCNSLIKDDDKLCPYCYMESKFELEEEIKNEDSGKWFKSFLGIKSPSAKVEIGTFDLFTPNETKKMNGLPSIEKENKSENQKF